jgi:hypothetical protein
MHWVCCAVFLNSAIKQPRYAASSRNKNPSLAGDVPWMPEVFPMQLPAQEGVVRWKSEQHTRDSALRSISEPAT